MQADTTESHVRRRTQEVNEFIFQLEKYTQSQNMLSDETLATIDKYKQEKKKYAIKDKQKSKLYQIQEANRDDAIEEVQNEFS